MHTKEFKKPLIHANFKASKECDMNHYYPRVADNIVHDKLSANGAVLIEGPKWCGKTTTAKHIANSYIEMDQPELKKQYKEMAELNPRALLNGDTPRLIDEWQIAPNLWNAVRYEVDQRDEFGQFILTGSAVPPDFDSSMNTGKCTTRKGTYDAYVTMTTPDYEHAQYTSPLVKGSYFTDTDLAGANPVCVIDELTALYLFGNTNVIGMTFELAIDNGIEEVMIVGIRETSADMLEVEQTYQAMGLGETISIEVPYTLADSFGVPIEGFSSVSITARDAESAGRVASSAVKILNSRHQDLGDNPFMQQKPMNLSDMLSWLWICCFSS